MPDSLLKLIGVKHLGSQLNGDIAELTVFNLYEYILIISLECTLAKSFIGANRHYLDNLLLSEIIRLPLGAIYVGTIV